MPTVNVVAELTVIDLLNAVSKLDEAELAEFEIGFDQIWLKRSRAFDQEAAQLVENHRLPPQHQARVRALLLKNREAMLTEAEEEELDTYMAQMDQALGETADELLKLAELRQKKQTSGQP